MPWFDNFSELGKICVKFPNFSNQHWSLTNLTFFSYFWGNCNEGELKTLSAILDTYLFSKMFQIVWHRNDVLNTERSSSSINQISFKPSRVQFCLTIIF